MGECFDSSIALYKNILNSQSDFKAPIERLLKAGGSEILEVG
jgi:hypothetical protein